MTSEKYKTKTIEEFPNNLVLEQIKEQIILYYRLYHKLRKNKIPNILKEKRKRTRTLLEEQNPTRT